MPLDREIIREPEAPELTPELIKIINQLCFRADNTPIEIPVLYVFGSTSSLDRLADKIHKLLKHYKVKTLILNGGFPSFTGSHQQSVSAGRGYLTLKHYLPSTQLYQLSFDATYGEPSVPLTKTTWHQTTGNGNRVWGEFLRIKKYGERNDIHYQEVKDLIKQIEIQLNELKKS